MIDLKKINESLNEWISHPGTDDNSQNLTNAIEFIAKLNNKIKFEKSVWTKDTQSKEQIKEEDKESICINDRPKLLSSVSPLIELFAKTKLRLISLLQEATKNLFIGDPFDLDRNLDHIHKIIETGINIDADCGITPISEFNLFMNAVWTMLMDSKVKEVNQKVKDQLVKILDKILKRNCITIDSGIHTIILMKKLNLEKKLSRQILDFIISSLSSCCENVSEPKVILNRINSSKYNSVSEEERKLYERFEESFHVTETCSSMMEAQYKYGGLLCDPK